jgi:hypothetical protein
MPGTRLPDFCIIASQAEEMFVCTVDEMVNKVPEGKRE